MGELALAAGGVVIGLGLLKSALGIVGSVAKGVESIDRAKKGTPSGAVAEATKPKYTIIDPSTGKPFESVEKATPKAIAASRGAFGLLKGAAGGLGAVLGGLALDYGAQKATEAGNVKTGAGLDVASSALSGAGMGAMVGSIVPVVGTAIGGAVGAAGGTIYGLVKNWNTLSKSTEEEKKKSEEEKKKKEDTKIEETVKSTPLPRDVQSKDLLEGVNRLNTTMIALLSYMKATASNTERTYRDMENLKNKVG
jgi:hypothetical protein